MSRRGDFGIVGTYVSINLTQDWPNRRGVVRVPLTSQLGTIIEVIHRNNTCGKTSPSRQKSWAFDVTLSCILSMFKEFCVRLSA